MRGSGGGAAPGGSPAGGSAPLRTVKKLRRLSPKRPPAARWAVLLAAIVIIFTGARLAYPLKYRDIVEAGARRAHLDPALVAAMIKAESGYDAEAVSPRGATGLMQIMPETAQWIAGQLPVENYHHGLLTEPDLNVTLGTWYLANLMDEFDGDLVLSLAAYNGGRGNVARWVSEGRLDPDADLSRRLESIPFPETRLYVNKVLCYRSIYKVLYRFK